MEWPTPAQDTELIVRIILVVVCEQLIAATLSSLLRYHMSSSMIMTQALGLPDGLPLSGAW